MQSMSDIFGNWVAAQDGDAQARALYWRHYSHRRYADGRRPKKIIGPGEYMLLIRPQGDAIFAWRKFLSDDGQGGVCCCIFHSEAPILSSLLIREADELAWVRWPGERHYTYVNPRKIKSTNPGYCFKLAGWHVTGRSKGGLVILAIEPPK